MKRTRFPQKRNVSIQKITRRRNVSIQKITPDEILKGVSKTDKVRMLEIQTEVQTRLINIKRDTFRIGKLLHEAKSILPHGMFTPFIDCFFDQDLPYSSAYFYMRIYEVFKDHPKIVQYIPSKYLLMMTSKKFPEEIVKVVNEHPKRIERESLEQINEVYDLFKRGTIGGSQFIELAKKQIKTGMDIWKGRTEHRLDANVRKSLYFGAGDVLKRINAVRKIARDMAGVYPLDPDSPEYKKLITRIDKTITGLQGLKADLENSKGLFKKISTKDGHTFISNL